MRRYRRSVVLFLLVPAVLCALGGTLYANWVVEGITENVVRLHVIANSDGAEDQARKLLVRDSVISYTKDLLKDCQSAEMSLEILQQHEEDIQHVAKTRLEAEGCMDEVAVYTGIFSFPCKKYADFALPAGEYLALRVVIGAGGGANWWCVLFPPLCFVNAGVAPAEGPGMEDVLPEESYEVIQTEPEGDVTVRFKIVEFVQEAWRRVKTSWKAWFG